MKSKDSKNIKKYFFFDIDNTLLVWEGTKTYVPDSTRKALKALDSNGHFLSIATGRSHIMAVDLMKDLGIHNMVSDGGNGILIEDKLLRIKPLDREPCIKLISECEEKGFAWGISVENSKVRLSPDNRFQEETRDIYMETKVLDGLSLDNCPEIYKVFVSCSVSDEEKIQSLSLVPYCRSSPEYIFVEPVHKELGIMEMMRIMNAPVQDVVVFGDASNDLSMFRKEWTSIAMGNAPEALKKRADYVTLSAAEDGIENALRHFAWI